jgi:GNAT superfamily N-acetyltransferase
MKIERIGCADLDRLRTFFRNNVESHRPDIDDSYFTHHPTGQDVTFLAEYDSRPAGYLTLRRKTLHDYYRQRNIPLLQDIWVFDDFQRRGIGNALMAQAEQYLHANDYRLVVITVGLMASYGSAQRLYAKRGYKPDGRGVFKGDDPLKEGDQLDHDAVLWLIKNLTDNLNIDESRLI